MVDYPNSFFLLSTWNDLAHLLDTQISGILILVQPAMLMMFSMSWTMNLLNSLESLPLMFPSDLGDYMASSMIGEDPGKFLGL